MTTKPTDAAIEAATEAIRAYQELHQGYFIFASELAGVAVRAALPHLTAPAARLSDAECGVISAAISQIKDWRSPPKLKMHIDYADTVEPLLAIIDRLAIRAFA